MNKADDGSTSIFDLTMITKYALLAGIGAALSLGSIANAGTTFAGSPVALGSNDQIDWSQLGATFTTLNSPASVLSNLGISATISDGGTLERRDEGNGWSGGYPNGDALIWNQDNGNDLVIDFATPVGGAGAQISTDYFGSFTWTISAFDSSNNLLGTYTGTGENADDLPFIGILSSSADISSIDLQAFNASFTNMSIDTLYLNDNGGSVPDAGVTSLMLGISVAALIALRRRTVQFQA
jgi:hypothetical protein